MTLRFPLIALMVGIFGCDAQILDARIPGAPGGSGGGGGGSSGAGGGGAAPVVVPPFECAPAADPAASVVLRLTPTQYRNAIEDLLGRAFTPAQVQAALASSQTAAHFAAIPVDGSGGKKLIYDSEDQRISTLLVVPQLGIATDIADWVAADPARQAAFARAFGGASACAAVTSSGCVDAVVAGLGLRALRRPLDPAEGDAAFYRGAYDAATWGGYRGLIAAYLMSPGFLFRTEFKGSAVDARSNLSRLSPFELASRLSFAITNSMPDEALFTAAEQGFAGAGNTVAEQVERLLQSPRARRQFDNFFRQWLRLDHVASFNPSAASVLPLMYPDSSAAALPASLDLGKLRLDAFEEMVALTLYYAVDKPGGSMRDVLTSDLSFATADVARIYGVASWEGQRPDGSVDESKLVRFPAGQRSGLFTRAGYLVSGYPDSNPIIRGARLRVDYLCDGLEPPDDTSPPMGYVPPAVASVRNMVTAKTEINGTACKGCHAYSINPLGFSFEGFDSFGRFRNQEAIFDATGKVSQWVPVNSVTAPDLDRNGNKKSSANAVELSQLVSQSERFHACFARHSLRYAAGRAEVVAKGAQTQDGCVLSRLTTASSTGSIQDVMRQLTKSPDFALRKIEN